MADAPKGLGEKLQQDQPPNTFILIAGIDAETWISLPNAGELWVALEGAGTAQIWHQGGNTENVPQGFSTFQVGAQDAITYTDNGQPMKLGWAYI